MNVSKEQNSANITELQGYLREIAQANGNIPEVIPDGIYGSETADAVKAFQREYGLPVTGEVDETTWKLIYSTYKGIRTFYSTLETIAPFTDRGEVIKRGDSGYLIYIIQAMLSTVGQFYKNIVVPSVTGIFDMQTENSIKQVQAVTGEDPTGQVDVVTWNKLAKLYNHHSRRDKVENIPALSETESAVKQMRSVG